ncbi:MAG: winged helix-turn-helix transcriptional regulator [Clostridiales bacterium]|nr:winged helix-turn-helix transcriptional regulator [Clostridiales bacterium]
MVVCASVFFTIVERKSYDEIPLRVKYSLSETGKTVVRIH